MQEQQARKPGRRKGRRSVTAEQMSDISKATAAAVRPAAPAADPAPDPDIQECQDKLDKLAESRRSSPLQVVRAGKSRAASLRTLFAISEDMAFIDDLLDKSGGDITGIEAEVDAFFADIEADLQGKADAYAAVIRQRLARAEIRKAEAARIGKLASTDAKVAKALKDRLRDFMALKNYDAIDGARCRVRLVNNGGSIPVDLAAEPKVIVDDVLGDTGLGDMFFEHVGPDGTTAAKLLDKLRGAMPFLTIKVSLDNRAIAKAVEAGIAVPAWAKAGERGKHIRID